MSNVPGIWQLKHKLHPRTGFMIFFPGTILLGMLVLLLFSQRVQAGGGSKGLALVFAIDAAVVCSLLWSDLGHAVSWDNDAVWVRQYGGRFLMRRHSFKKVRFSDIRGLIFHSPPRGVPPRFPLLELDAPSNQEGPALFIDPNYFTGSTLVSFIDQLCARTPEMRAGKQAKAVGRLLRTLGA